MKVLWPPGIGDCHWLALKAESVARELNGGEPLEVWLCSMHDGKDRAGDYIKRLPFVKFGGYFDMRRHRQSMRRVFVEGRVLRGFQGFDAFYAYNRAVEDGTPVEEWWPGSQCEANFRYALAPSDVETATTASAWKRSPYILASFYRHGWYREWSERLEPVRILRAIRRQCPDHRILVTGAGWDVPAATELAQAAGAECIAGETSIEEFFGLIRGASAYVGHAAGNAMMAVHLRTPTVMLWGREKFRKPMWTVWAPPGEEHYAPLDLDRETPQSVAEEVAKRV